ncbi:zinc-dependent peptidase [Hydrogenophaga pseudoflava]|uniref:Protein MtfA n=1 Tax=Hydrogenophaga pseudoflava TaxID=47421 RepID=A0A4P6WYK6_HYDPS|nr:M90 family metallopeptidase [Hydrogenophaga pseudoflava]QBM29212.1 Protein MtfA [Hydrogenophaga pseudoflava]
MIQTLQRWLPRRWRTEPQLPDGPWSAILGSHPFLAELSGPDRFRLRQLSGHFLMEKEFHGAHGLVVTDPMALAIAAQACLPLLHIRPPSGQAASNPLDALAWYDDFVGIVVQPGAALARRRVADASGVVHHYEEVLAGEAMDRGPVMLSWQEVSQAPDAASTGSNVVIHEFVHKIDMRGMHAGGNPDGAPALVAGLWGTRSDAQAREHWRRTMAQAYDHFRESVSMAERFGAERPWLDDYAATNPAEFFAVTCEAYFVSRPRFGQTFPSLLALYDGFFRPDA